MITFTVYGAAAPKGSAKAFVIKGTNRAVVTSATKGLKAWEQTIRAVAQDHATQLLVGPVSLSLRFHLPRPKALRVTKYEPHTKRPDLDKLVRGAIDALTGIIWKDDAQVWAITTDKRYVDTHETVPFVEFCIREEWGGAEFGD